MPKRTNKPGLCITNRPPRGRGFRGRGRGASMRGFGAMRRPRYGYSWEKELSSAITFYVSALFVSAPSMLWLWKGWQRAPDQRGLNFRFRGRGAYYSPYWDSRWTTTAQLNRNSNHSPFSPLSPLCFQTDKGASNLSQHKRDWWHQKMGEKRSDHIKKERLGGRGNHFAWKWLMDNRRG